VSSEYLLFWASVLLVGYTYIGYPALMRVWAALRPRSTASRAIAPTVTVVIIAHNEAPRIQGRLANLLALEYPQDRLEILVASDGSTDGTPERACAYEDGGVRVIPFVARRGKPAVLNELVRQARGEIVILADARQRFQTGALRQLVAPFADPEVGAVSGELVLTGNADGTAVGEGVGFYWRYEKLIRWSESRVDSAVGATGAIYAIRRDLFEAIPEDTVLDDVLIPMRIARRGYRVLFEPRACAFDLAAATADEEFRRKVRTIAGNFQLFARERWLLNPLRNRLWFQTISHKGLRLLTPLLLITAFGANLFLADSPFYRWMLMGQISFYAAALGGYALRDARRRIPLLTVPYVACLLSWATVVALLRFVTKRQAVTWEKPPA
jgi:cellulose synthase/poly-beta-1,6-N-acetylglucosamine synthase-like glycosyltransferase